MSSNGYVRRCCSKCLFYADCGDYGCRCQFINDEGEYMRWVSASDYDLFKEYALKYDEDCPHFICRKDVKDYYRGVLNDK